MNICAIQWNLRLPSCLGASRFSLLGLFVVYLLSAPFFAQAQAHIAEPGLRRSAQLLAAEDAAGVRAAVGRAGEQFGLLEQAGAAEQRGGEGFVFDRGEPDAAAFECLP